MPRPTRDLTTDNRFHVINHGVDGQDLFSIHDDWVLFESMIGRVCDDYGFVVNAYALMSNHYHLLADLTECNDRDGVSEAVGVLQSTYAKYFNDRTGRRGPLFEPRFLSYGVDGDTKTHRSMRYIHRNPIDICGRRALGNYRWSSLPVLIGRRESPGWLDCSLFAPQDPIAHLADLADCRTEDLLPIGVMPPQRPTTIAEIKRAVDLASTPELDPAIRRDVVCLLALDLRAADVVAIASTLGCSTSSVRSMASRSRTKRRDDASFQRHLDRIKQEILDSSM